ncbi:hypothetical protein ACIGO9_30625 [Nocardia asteroides]|uniref:hypothetical protein n=1 Tax=Nocardia asteroides TaxID=1824 RepID=UPI0037C76989
MDTLALDLPIPSTRVSQRLLDQLTPNEPPARVALSYGLRADSSVIIARILDPDRPEFARNLGIRDVATDLVVVTAMTGSEWDSTRQWVERHILPLLRSHNVRYIQAARSAKTASRQGENIRVLSDTRSPTRLFTGGDYTLYQEMSEGGTVPQLGGARKCSVRSKGDVLDPILGAVMTAGPWSHLIGFEASEMGRADSDAKYNKENGRTGVYPLIELGWKRSDVEDYAFERFGEVVPKSACGFCCFSFSKRGRPAQMERYRQEPGMGVQTLLLEHNALALNPRQGLAGNQERVVDIMRAAELDDVLTAFHAALAASQFCLYEVRRFAFPGGKAANKWRSVQILSTGTRTDMAALLTAMPGEERTGEDNITRRWLRDGTGDDAIEYFWVAAPSGIQDKQRPSFEAWWASLDSVPDRPTNPVLARLHAARAAATTGHETGEQLAIEPENDLLAAATAAKPVGQPVLPTYPQKLTVEPTLLDRTEPVLGF